MNPRLTCFSHDFYILSLSLIPCKKFRQTNPSCRELLNTIYTAQLNVINRSPFKTDAPTLPTGNKAETYAIKLRKRDYYCLRLNLKYRFYEAESFGMLTMTATSNRNRINPIYAVRIPHNHYMQKF